MHNPYLIQICIRVIPKMRVKKGLRSGEKEGSLLLKSYSTVIIRDYFMVHAIRISIEDLNSRSGSGYNDRKMYHIFSVSNNLYF